MSYFDKPVRQVILLWAIWAALVIGFQAVVITRLEVKPPDTVLDWTEGETLPGAHDSQPYLLEEFLNQQVAYDSEFYLSIAINGYDDPVLRSIWADPADPQLVWNSNTPLFGIANDFPDGRPPGAPANYEQYSLNYAFFPFYPLVIRALSAPLTILGLNPIATATLAGVLISLLGALLAMLALYDLTRDQLQEGGAKKAAFYLIAFPTGFFLAMVHTEGLFVGLAFAALALLYRKHWLWAALLAAGATTTRAVGVALIIPFALAWLNEALPYLKSLLKRGQDGDAAAVGFRWDLIWKGVLGLSPLLAFALWNALLGNQFNIVESAFFGRGALVIERSLDGWADMYRSLFGARKLAIATSVGRGILILTGLLVVYVLLRGWIAKKLPRFVPIVIRLGLFLLSAALVYSWLANTNNGQRSLYYILEFGATILAVVACAYMLRSRPGLALFGLMVIAISFFSGGPQGMPRYILGVPAVFIMLGELGQKDEIFDRGWTTASVMLMSFLALVFAFNFWVG